MKKIEFIFLISALILMISCGGSKNAVADFDERTVNHQRIAVVPFYSKIKLKDKQKEKITDKDLEELNLAQGKEVQNAVESYLLNRNLRVRVQSQSMTNSKLRSAGINMKNLTEMDVTKLANILGVDAVVVGSIETEQPMSDEIARGLNVAKKLAWNAGSTLGGIGRAINTSTNKGLCSLGLFEKEHGDRLWYHRDDIEMGQGSKTMDIIEKMMKEGAKNFPYKR